MKLDKIDIPRNRFREISEDQAWVPGEIEVVFKDPARSGVKSWNFPDEEERKEFAEVWPASVQTILRINELVSWKPSFPLRYSWTKGSDEQARTEYRAEGREKFVTLNFAAEAETRRIASELRVLPEIEQAVAVPRVRPPSDPFAEPLIGTGDQPEIICDNGVCLESQWYIFRCKVHEAWQTMNALGKGISGRGVVVADIDWGFNVNHQDLKTQIRKTQNIGLNSSDPFNVANGADLHHGTAALGLAGAAVNRQGIAGVAFGSELWAIQAGMNDVVHPKQWAAGIKFVRDEPTSARKVIILEVETAKGGNIEMDLLVAQEIRLAIVDNIVVCVPAGNGARDAGIGDDNRPISETGSILVGATNFGPQNNVRGISNFGRRLVVYAPGDLDRDVTCGPSDDGYLAGLGGTSGAVAKVAGVAALMLEKNPNLTHEKVRDILARSRIPVFDASSTQIGVLLNAERAVHDAKEAWWKDMVKLIHWIVAQAKHFFAKLQPAPTGA